MMNHTRRIKKIVLSVICLLLILATLGGCNPTDNIPHTDTTETTVQETYFSLNASAYGIISSQSNESTQITKAITLLRDASKALLGKSITTTDDWYRGELERYEVEILIGSTNRPESVAADADLTYYDYMYEVVSPNTVVICGGSDESTVFAVRKFLLDCYGYESGRSNGTLRDIPVGTSYVYRHAYGLTDFTLCKKSIDAYTIVHPNTLQGRNAAKSLQEQIEKISGKTLATVSTTDFSGKDAILIGCSDLNGSHLFANYGEYNYMIKLEQNEHGNVLIIDSTLSLETVIQAFITEFLDVAPKQGSYALNFSTEGRAYCVLIDEMNGLVLSSESQVEQLADGVAYRELVYKDANGLPINAYALEIDLNKASVLNATPNYGNQITNVTATTPEAMQAVANRGYDVIAGVNADFFWIDTDKSPYGLCIKNGEVLHEGNRPWFGITADGIPVIGTYDEYLSDYDGKLTEAVGGSHIVLKDGMYHNITHYNDFASARDPRTAVGITKDGKLILLVVDGRSILSNGASLADLGSILLDLGVTDALNLDGGGSSTMVTATANGSFVTQNDPSDGKLREVYNSLVVVTK
ncbi:MAG: phosphodiester glycosidase family protein [Clostridia bacterium]|nr:phosphodiester glycosidase family protein [Clostridia bacterium]